MSKVIYKYELTLGPNQLWLPSDYEIVKVGEQEDRVMVWVLFSCQMMYMSPVELRIVGTGQEFDDEFTYAGTVLMESGLVWHVLHKRGE